MKKLAILLGLAGALAATTVASPEFDDFFVNNTLRIDYYHTGTHDQEFFALDQCYEEGEWAGSQSNLIDRLNLGEYQVRVYDVKTSQLLYSRGYSTIFNEWQTTAEAKSRYHTIHESLLVPMPKDKIQVSICRRDRNMIFREIFTTLIDPGDPVQINRSQREPAYRAVPLMKNGPPAKKVDVVILGDGYAEADLDKLRRDAKKLNEVMFATTPFKERKSDFNVWLIEVISPESGISKPDKDIWKVSALGCEYNTFGSKRYVLSEDNRAIRNAAGQVPYDAINILINDDRYGGGGIYNLYTTTYTIPDHAEMAWQVDYVYVHEFGHSFAGLGDEYYSSQVSYEEFYSKDVEPWEKNVTALLNPDELKWKDLVEEDTPLPTPWEKAEYDSLARERSKLDRLAPDYYEKREPIISAQKSLLETSPNAGIVGAFEGAGYEARGLYRPAIDCRMFSLSLTDFDPVCRRALEQVIDSFTK